MEDEIAYEIQKLLMASNGKLSFYKKQIKSFYGTAFNNVSFCWRFGKNGNKDSDWITEGSCISISFLNLIILDPPYKCGFTLAVVFIWYWVWSARTKWIFEKKPLSLDHLSAKLRTKAIC